MVEAEVDAVAEWYFHQGDPFDVNVLLVYISPDNAPILADAVLVLLHGAGRA